MARGLLPGYKSLGGTARHFLTPSGKEISRREYMTRAAKTRYKTGAKPSKLRETKPETIQQASIVRENYIEKLKQLDKLQGRARAEFIKNESGIFKKQIQSLEKLGKTSKELAKQTKREREYREAEGGVGDIFRSAAWKEMKKTLSKRGKRHRPTRKLFRALQASGFLEDWDEDEWYENYA